MKDWKVDVPEGVSGDWAVQRFTVTKEQSDLEKLRSLCCVLHRGAINPGTYTRLVCKGRGVVMSDSPDECRDHFEPFRIAQRFDGGRILIHGMGLGVLLKKMLSLDTVEHVDVVEISEDVIKLVGPHYEDPRLHIHHADVFSHKWKPGTKWDVVWHDIWDTICEDNLPQMIKLHRSFGNRSRWQGSWCRHVCESIRRGW